MSFSEGAPPLRIWVKKISWWLFGVAYGFGSHL
jgi:hypothetical protein